MHLIRASMRFVSYKDRKAVAAMLKLIYTAPTVEAAEAALLEFQDSELGRRYPATAQTWLNAWERFIPFPEFPPELRKVIYTTNSIESLNYPLRKIIKNRGHFPNDTAVVKLLWLAIRDIEDKRARQRAKETGKQRNGSRHIRSRFEASFRAVLRAALGDDVAGGDVERGEQVGERRRAGADSRCRCCSVATAPSLPLC